MERYARGFFKKLSLFTVKTIKSYPNGGISFGVESEWTASATAKSRAGKLQAARARAATLVMRDSKLMTSSSVMLSSPPLAKRSRRHKPIKLRSTPSPLWNITANFRRRPEEEEANHHIKPETNTLMGERKLSFSILTRKKPPLCKGRWHGEAVTEGL
jgi:hypothetical protein